MTWTIGATPYHREVDSVILKELALKDWGSEGQFLIGSKVNYPRRKT